MNRKQRRAIQKRGGSVPKEAVYNVKKSDLIKMRKEANEKAVDNAADAAMVLLLALPIKVMRDKHKWGAKRLTEFAEALTDEYQAFSDGDMSLEEYADFVYQYTGITFERSN